MTDSLRFSGDIFGEIDRLQQQVAQAFRTTYEAPSNIRAIARGGFPAINIGTTAETIEVVAFAPGIDPKAVQVSIDRGLLLIAGERSGTVQEGDERISIYAQERFTGPFRRVVSLPEDADPNRVNASYRDGFLRVSVGKRESSKPRQIEIR
ncbi:MAG: Hsp20/alpha crystallin family protein [Burkholderiales bacterium]